MAVLVSGWELLGYFLPSLALMLGDQNMLQRFASAKNSDEAKKSNIGMFIGEILVIISIVLVVTQAAKLYPTLDVPSNVIFQVAVDYLPLAFGALVMCACMAFIVTTADSYLLVSVQTCVHDIGKTIRPQMPERTEISLSRIFSIVLPLGALVIALYIHNAYNILMFAWSFYAASAGIPAFAALFWKKATKTGVMAGLLGC